MPKNLNPLALFKTIWVNRTLILRLTKRDVETRYRGSFLGISWAIITPLLLISVYTFIFSVVFKARWDVPIQGKANFALILFCGLILFNIFSECISRAPQLMVSNVIYIKKVVFPLEILPVVSLLSALFNALVSFVVLLVAHLIVLGVPPISILLSPLIILPLALLVLGLSWFLASVGVYIRDVQQFIGVLVMVIMFMTPLFYPLSALPAKIQPVIQLSPLTTAIEQLRNLLFGGGFPNVLLWSIQLALAWFVAWIGYIWFMITRKGFADVV